MFEWRTRASFFRIPIGVVECYLFKRRRIHIRGRLGLGVLGVVAVHFLSPSELAHDPTAAQQGAAALAQLKAQLADVENEIKSVMEQIEHLQQQETDQQNTAPVGDFISANLEKVADTLSEMRNTLDIKA